MLSSILNPQSSILNENTYWEARAQRFAHEGWGLRAVCSYGMPAFYNGYVHLIQRQALAPWLRVAAGPTEAALTTVLEIGCGVGRWSRRLARAGAHVIGTDLAPAMIAEARRRAALQHVEGRCHFHVVDAAEIELDQRFDRILCVTVLQHILERDRVERVIQRMAKHLAPGGRIVLLEVAPSNDDKRCNTATFVARREEEYRELFARAGLSCVATTGVDPLRLKTWFLPLYGSLPRMVAACGLFAVTAFTLPFDLIASRWMCRASWHKVFVLARQNEGCGGHA